MKVHPRFVYVVRRLNLFVSTYAARSPLLSRHVMSAVLHQPPCLDCHVHDKSCAKFSKWVSFEVYNCSKNDNDLILNLELYRCMQETVDRMATLIIVGSIVLGLAIHVAAAIIPPPERLPYLFDAMFVSLSFCHIMLCYLYLNWRQWKL